MALLRRRAMLGVPPVPPVQTIPVSIKKYARTDYIPDGLQSMTMNFYQSSDNSIIVTSNRTRQVLPATSWSYQAKALSGQTFNFNCYYVKLGGSTVTKNIRVTSAGGTTTASLGTSVSSGTTSITIEWKSNGLYITEA